MKFNQWAYNISLLGGMITIFVLLLKGHSVSNALIRAGAVMVAIMVLTLFFFGGLLWMTTFKTKPQKKSNKEVNT
jgi:cbb3-type cytochrome oxidase subunit 3